MNKNIFNSLNAIGPVLYIINNDDILSVQFEDFVPSEEQQSEIDNILSTWPLEKIRDSQLLSLENNWKNIVKNGWTTPYGYSLGIDIADVALLNGIFTLAKEANNLGITDPVSIVDTDGQSHSFNLQDLTMLMLQYGQARSSLSNSYANIKNQINSASTIEDLEAININI